MTAILHMFITVIKYPMRILSIFFCLDESPFTPATNNRDKASFMDSLPFEYPCFGIGDYRDPAFKFLIMTE